MRLIDVDKLESEMYHNAFEIDTNLQKWDSGCWIRYKMFENVIEKLPTIEAIPIQWIRQWVEENYELECDYAFEQMLDDWRKENESIK